ncbi:MAG: hypothetical protein M1820_001033 [Bogoriella megaspora]|nr:MAG: hypothetical protein M1820_001033 [Bogoriella megaspora]
MKAPIVLAPVTLLTLLEYILKNHVEQAIVVVCSSREDFLRKMLQPLQNSDEDHTSCPLLTPTLELLKSSQTVQLVFCPTLQTLHAWLCSRLSIMKPNHTGGNDDGVPGLTDHGIFQGQLLVIIDVVILHRNTSSFSAQGLGRTFAAMVDSAFHLRRQLVIAECFEPEPQEPALAASEDESEHTSTVAGHNHDAIQEKPWNEDVSILNVTTKSFGAGERGWMGRTVKIGQIVARWCTFKTLPENASNG